MATIVIPSKNIFEINDEKVLNNQITKVIININDIVEQKGNVLDRLYQYIYYEVTYTQETETIEPVVNAVYTNTTNTNGIRFGLIGARLLTATLAFKIDKNCVINLEEGNFPYSLTIERTIYDKNEDTTNTELITGITPTNPRYNYDTQILEIDYQTYVLYNPAKYVLKETIQLVGNYIEIQQTDISYGNGDRVFNNEGNELITNLTKYNDNLLTEHIANKQLNEYANGKEVATIRCAINDYYDTNNQQVISKSGTYRMLFELHDKCIPYVRSGSGQDIPMSRNQYGNAKIFNIIGIKVYYDGAIWQKLTLQEA